MKHVIKFAGLNITGLMKEDVLADRKQCHFVVTANAQIINLYGKLPAFREAIRKATVTLDGQIPYLLARLQNPSMTFCKLSGSDLVYDLLKQAKTKKRRVFLLGAQSSSNAAAVQKIRSQYGVQVAGFSPPSFDFPASPYANQEMLNRIRDFEPHYLFVGFGAPKQELWIAANLPALQEMGVKLVIGCGGSIDFLSGQFHRAPSLVQKLGLEGFYRLYKQPNWARVSRLLASFSIFYNALPFRRNEEAFADGPAAS